MKTASRGSSRLTTAQRQELDNFYRLIIAQVLSIFAIFVVNFGIIIPGTWTDGGFPALLGLLNIQHTRVSAFKDLSEDAWGGVPLFACAAAALHTGIVILAFFLARTLRAIDCGKAARMAISVAGIIAACVPFYVAVYLSLSWTFANEVGFGFDYAYWFFSPKEGVADFARTAASCTTLTFSIAATIFALADGRVHGLFPLFAQKASTRCMGVLFASYAIFRYILTPTVIQNATSRIGLLNAAAADELALDKTSFAALASLSHTLVLGAGMVCHHATRELLASTPSLIPTHATQKNITSIAASLFKAGTLAGFAAGCFYLLSAWLNFAAQNNVQFVARYTEAFFNSAHSPEASVLAGSSYVIYFVVGALLIEVDSLPAQCATCATKLNIRKPSNDHSYAKPARLTKKIKKKSMRKSGEEETTTKEATKNGDASPRRRRRVSKSPSARRSTGAAPSAPSMEGTTNTKSMHSDEKQAKHRQTHKPTESLADSLWLPATISVSAAVIMLYAADPAMLTDSMRVIRSVCAAVADIIPSIWRYLYDNYTKEQLMFMTLPVLFLTELPLYFFTVLDYLKLKSLEKYRLKYSKLDHKRPRTYPTNAEMWKAWKVHCQNFFGVYCTVFLLGVGAGCHLQIFPYDMQRELPDRWFLEFIVVSIFSDSLFYWIHRIAHLPRFYKHMHKMHHEWVYSIALAHHYMDWSEALLFMIPPVLPPVLFGTHIMTMWVYMFWVQINAILGHSAFCIPYLSKLKWLPFLQPQYHDLHHLRFTVNYGATYPFTDMLYGTYRYEPIIYVDGVDPVLVCEHQQEKRSLADVKDDDDPFESEEVTSGGDGPYGYAMQPSTATKK